MYVKALKRGRKMKYKNYNKYQTFQHLKKIAKIKAQNLSPFFKTK